MKAICLPCIGWLLSTFAVVAAADEIKTVAIGDAEIVYDFQPTEAGVAILTLAGLVTETNDTLRGLKNSDPRRLSKLGQLIYQCKLMVYGSSGAGGGLAANAPVLISKNYSLFTGVNLPLGDDERVGIQVQALRVIDDASLFSDSLGRQQTQSGAWETLGDGSTVDLRQFNINALQEGKMIETSESVEIKVRFPVFQLEKPVSQWNYNFSLKDFKQAVRLIDDDCTPAKFADLIEKRG